MPENEAPHVVAVASVRTVEPIDGGATMAVSMTTAAGGELRVLLPTGAMGGMLFLIAEAFGAGPDGCRSRLPGPSRTSGTE